MSNADPRAAGGATYRMLRELGARAQHSYAAIREPHELVVAQRFVRVALPELAASIGRTGGEPLVTPLDAASVALLLRDARCLAKNWHSNIARVRHVDLAGGELTIATELLDGATLADLLAEGAAQRTTARDPSLPMPVLVRILLDVLAGLNALHGLRDGMNAPLGAIHGALCPANVVVGKDGVARLVDVLRPRPVRIVQASSAAGYAAPEALDVGGTDDPRADVYAVGVVLWEALAGRRLFDEIEPTRVLSRQREGEIVLPSIHPKSPFARLAEVAMRALAFDPSLRFQSALEMASELRKVAGPRLASGASVAEHVGELAGDRIRMRRALLDPTASGTLRRASERSIAAATLAVQQRDAAHALSGEGPVSSPPVSSPPVSSWPVLSPPVRRRSSMVRASPRALAPTVSAETSDTLLAASRPSEPPAAEPPVALRGADAGVAHGPDVVLDEPDVELQGPRGSSPELNLEAALADAILAGESGRPDKVDLEVDLDVEIDLETAPLPPISPITPNVPFARLDRTSPLVVGERAARQAEAGATAERAAPRTRRHGRIALVLMALVAILAGGASFAMRMRAHRADGPPAGAGLTEPPAIAPPPVATLVAPAAPSVETAPAAPERPLDAPSPAPVATTAATTPSLAAPAASTPLLAAPTSAPTPRAVVRAPAAAPAAPAPPTKPKKSIYEPE